MSPVAVGLILVAAFAHAGWNVAAKRAGQGGVTFVWLCLTVSAAIVVPLAAISLVLTHQPLQWHWLPISAVSGLFQVSYFLLLQRGYAIGDMSVVYPLARGTGPLLSVVLAIVLLHERVGLLGLVGAGVVIAGVLVIGTATGGAPTRLAASVGYALATGVMIAGYTLWDANAVTVLGVPPLIEFVGGSVVEAIVLAPFALANRAKVAVNWREHRREALIVAVFSPLAYVLVLYAMRLAPVALVAPARELSIVIGSVVAWRYFHEPEPVRRLTGAAIVLAGVAALALG
ncbi:MAG TPA: EamA family transporter [Pseudonocardiaceae bacterium]|nr:EamA family transporter [Pseudonocardiaceae bacterium]